MDKHTPGPWAVINGSTVVKLDDPVTQGAVGVVIADCGDILDERSCANARLIATAPELLECLKAAVGIIGHPDDAFTRLAQSVIAKAEGE